MGRGVGVLAVMLSACDPFGPETRRTTAYGGGQLEVTITGDFPMVLTAPGPTQAQLDALTARTPRQAWATPWLHFTLDPDSHVVGTLLAELDVTSGPFTEATANWQGRQLGLQTIRPGEASGSLDEAGTVALRFDRNATTRPWSSILP